MQETIIINYLLKSNMRRSDPNENDILKMFQIPRNISDIEEKNVRGNLTEIYDTKL